MPDKLDKVKEEIALPCALDTNQYWNSEGRGHNENSTGKQQFKSRD